MNWLDIRSSENLGRIRESGTTQIILPNISCQIIAAATAGQVRIAWFAPPAPVTGHGYLICPHCHLCKLPPPSLEHSAVSPLLSLPASHAQSGVGVSDCQHLTRAQLPGKLGKQVYGALISSGGMWALVDEVGFHQPGVEGAMSRRASRGRWVSLTGTHGVSESHGPAASVCV